MQRDFLGGVIEGFYGRMWTLAERQRLFHWMQDWGLTTYFYCPKDDLKHRALWRDPYNDSELSLLRESIESAHERRLRFVYGLSPGLDIRFSDVSERDRLRARFQQMIDVGVQDFALLFDDLPGSLQADDQQTFDSLAAAQSHVTNAIFKWLSGQLPDCRLLFCPTPYCDRMDQLQLGGKEYLDTIGKNLHPSVDVLWTGPEIVSDQIPVDSIERLSRRIRRKPIIWDNLHANDYDMRRLYCGPYTGRSADLKHSVAGILSNPNNEFEINYVPLRTLADYLSNPDTYDPRAAYLAALRDWTTTYETLDHSISETDVRLLADCYYLPFQDGEKATELLGLVAHLVDDPVETWGDRYAAFLALHQQVIHVFESLTKLTQRELFYAWSRRVWEWREELDMIRDYLACKRVGGLTSGWFESATHLPHTYRGGVVAKLQRHLVTNDQGRLGKAIRP